MASAEPAESVHAAIAEAGMGKRRVAGIFLSSAVKQMAWLFFGFVVAIGLILGFFWWLVGRILGK